MIFTADPGPAVVVAMSDLRDRFRIVANSVVVIEPPRPLERLPVGSALWTPHPDFRTATTAWLLAGGAHHTVMSTAVGLEVVADFARIVGVEFTAIDPTTTLASFEDRLRLNQVYHRLAQGI